METKIECFNFKNQKPEFNFLLLPMLILGLFALVAFILTSFWQYDLLSAEFLARGMKLEGVKYWTQTYMCIGFTELMVVLAIAIMILVESFFQYQIKQDSAGFWSKNRWIVLLIYFLILGIWLPYNIYEIAKYNWEDTGFGPGIDYNILDSYKYQQLGKALAFSFQTVALVYGFYYVHFRLVKKPNFWAEEYWIDGIKVVSFFIISYSLVIFLKGFLSRPYYFNYVFGDLLDELDANGHHDWVQHYLDQSTFKYGFNGGDGHWADNIPGAWPWYKANGYFKSGANMPQLSLFSDYAFPSGHVNATYSTASLFYFLIGKNRKFSWWKKLLVVFFFFHLLSMTFALVCMRGHWISDLAFSHLWALSMLVIVNLVGNKIVKKIRTKKSAQIKTR